MLREADTFSHKYRGHILGIAAAEDHVVAFYRHGKLDVRKAHETGLRPVCTIVHRNSRYGDIAFVQPYRLPLLLVTDNAYGQGVLRIVNVCTKERVGQVGSIEPHAEILCIASSGTVIAVAWCKHQGAAHLASRIDLFEGDGRVEWSRCRTVHHHDLIDRFLFFPDSHGLLAFHNSDTRVTEIGVYNAARDMEVDILYVALSVGSTPYQDGWLFSSGGTLKFMKTIGDTAKDGVDPLPVQPLFVGTKDLAVCPRVGVFALDDCRLRLFLDMEVVHMRAMSPVRVAWMVAVIRVALHYTSGTGV